MAEEARGEEKEKIPKLQALYDDLFFLFLLGAVVMVVFYTLWGVMEVANVPLWQPK